MNRILAAAILVLSLPIFQPAKEDRSAIILPNPKLLTCRISDCSQLWLDNAVAAPVSPKQLIIDSNQHCVHGMTAIYERYEKWAVQGFEKTSLDL